MKKIALVIVSASVVALSAGVTFVGVKTGTVTNHMEVLREKSYESLEELVSDSSIIVRVAIGDAEPVLVIDPDGRSGPSTTTSNARILEVVAAPNAIPLPKDLRVERGAAITVTQIGLPGTESVVTLKPGGEYLLFLTPSLISGRGPADFLPVGVWTGIYSSTKSGEFQQVRNEYDSLPGTISLEQVEGFSRGS